MRLFPSLLALALSLLLTACASLRDDASYVLQAAGGHLALMQAARPVAQWLADDSASPALKNRLQLTQRMRQFAVTELALPDNPSYQRYADLNRRAVVWNVVAAPPLSLTLKTWCFVVTGCIGYRGYFDEAQARAQAQVLQAQGLEVRVYGVPAYSTLGWLNWAGGDPLLNTFINYPEGELAGLIFHELAHQQLYVPDDTMFNESFATAVEQLGARRWLSTQAPPEAQLAFEGRERRRQQFRALCLATRTRLAAIYQQQPSASADKPDLLALKALAMQDFRSDYQRLKAQWGGNSGYDDWVAQANNAAFGAQAAYDEWVPGFEALFAREGQDWPRFYQAVQALAQKPPLERRQLLNALNALGTLNTLNHAKKGAVRG